MTFVRARHPEQKEERRAQLLTTARQMLDEGTPLSELGLNALARRAGITKSNVYRYFESREAVLLELLKEEWFAWFQALTTTWAPPTDDAAALRALMTHMASTLAARPRLCLLTTALPSVLEQNVSTEAVINLKLLSLSFFEQAAAFMCGAVPALTASSAQQLLQDGAVVIAGLWPHAHPTPAVGDALRSDPRLTPFRWDFERDLERLLQALATAAVSSSS